MRSSNICVNQYLEDSPFLPQIPGKPQFNPGFNRPSFITDNLQHFESFCAETNNVLSLLLSSLSKTLNLPPEQSLSACHRTDAPSPDIIRLLHYQPQPATETGNPQTAHTDLGSLTLLFTGEPGLQVLTPESREWAFVMPKKGCAVVNVGDGKSISLLFVIAFVGLWSRGYFQVDVGGTLAI